MKYVSTQPYQEPAPIKWSIAIALLFTIITAEAHLFPANSVRPISMTPSILRPIVTLFLGVSQNKTLFKAPNLCGMPIRKSSPGKDTENSRFILTAGPRSSGEICTIRFRDIVTQRVVNDNKNLTSRPLF